MKKHLGAALAIAALTLGAAPAHADVIKTDPGDDVGVPGGWEVDPSLKAAAELTKVTLDPTDKAMTVTLRVGAVHADGKTEGSTQQSFLVSFDRVVDGFTYYRSFELRNTDGKVRWQGNGVPPGSRCQRSVVKYGAKNLRLTLPWTCMGDFTRGSFVGSMYVSVQASKDMEFTGDTLATKGKGFLLR